MAQQILADLAAERLAEAMELIKNPKDWCQGGMGKDKYGRWTNPWEDYCVKRCALGSVIAVSQGAEDPVYHLATAALDSAARHLTPLLGVIGTNDTFPAEKAHGKIMGIFPIAIEHLRSVAAQRKQEMRGWHPAAAWSAQILTRYAT